jgi:DnaA family protein
VNQQLVLDIAAAAPPSLENFVAGSNGEALAALEALAAGRERERLVHLWGAPGSGKTHLLRALAALPLARYVDCAVAGAQFEFDEDLRVYALDNVESASAADQIAIFNLFNEVRARRHTTLTSASRVAPAYLAVREDLRTRLGWGLVFQLAPLNDVQTEAALRRHAAGRGLALSPEVGHFLLTRFARDVASLVAVVDALDRFALERQRPLTLPLVREWLQGQERSVHVP